MYRRIFFQTVYYRGKRVNITAAQTGNVKTLSGFIPRNIGISEQIVKTDAEVLRERY